MAETAVTSALGWDNFFSTTTTGALTATTTTIPLATPPTSTEGFLVLDPGGANEIIFYNSVSGNNVIVPTTDDRGRGDSTAQAHSSGITVKMNTVGMMFEALQSGLGLSATFNLPAGVVKNADLATSAGEIGGAWSDWSPSYVNITVGNGTVVAKYNQIGKTVHVYFNLTFGSTTSITSNNTISLPVTASSDYVVAEGNLMGAATFHDATGSVNVGAVRLQSTTTFLPIVYGAAGSYANESGCTATIPYTWTTSDKLNFTFSYQAA